MKLFTSSGYQKDVYLLYASDLVLPDSEAAQLLSVSRQELKNMTSEELIKLGCRRLDPTEADQTMSDKFAAIISGTVEYDGEEITVESGLRICDEIRELARPFCRKIDRKNISFVEMEIDGDKETLVMINGLDALIPGTMPPVDVPTIFTCFDGGRPRNNDSEFKFLERFGQAHTSSTSSGEIALFTEQEPCEISCKKVIELQFPNKFAPRFNLHVSATYPTQDDRVGDVERRSNRKKAVNKQEEHGRDLS